MVFNPDWFVLHPDFQGISAPSGGTACSHAFPTYYRWPGCSPAGTYYRLPYHRTMSRDISASWIMPEACVLKQFVASNWAFGTTDGAAGTRMDFYVDGVRYAGWIQNSSARAADRGTVWDLNDKVVLQGTTISITMQQYRGPNQNNNNIICALIGQWLRVD